MRRTLGVQKYSVWEKDAKTQGASPNLGRILRYDLPVVARLDVTRTPLYGYLIPGYVKLGGNRNFPTVAMVANLAKPTPERRP